MSRSFSFIDLEKYFPELPWGLSWHLGDKFIDNGIEYVIISSNRAKEEVRILPYSEVTDELKEKLGMRGR